MEQQDKRINFTILENDIIGNPNKYDKNELLAYVAIGYYANKDGECFPSYEGVAKIMRTSRTTAVKAIQGLVEKGIIKLENRKEDEKKKELTSNLYTLVSSNLREEIANENRKYLIKKGIEYKKRYAKGQVTKIANKNAKLKEELENGKKNTSVPTGIETDVTTNNSFDKIIIPQESRDCTQEKVNKNRQKVSNELQVRLDLLNDAGIKYIPFKSEPELIEGLDLEILQKAINVTVEQSNSNSWKYVLTTYDSICVKINKEKQDAQNTAKPKFVPNYKPRFSGGIGMARSNFGGTYFEDWNEEDFNRAVESKQAEKWGVAL